MDASFSGAQHLHYCTSMQSGGVHPITYWRLLDAAGEGADWREVVGIVFGIDPVAEPKRAKVVHDTHLARARWMSETGYRHYIDPAVSRYGDK